MDMCLRDFTDFLLRLRVGVLSATVSLLVATAALGQDETPLPLFELASGTAEASGFSFVTANDGERLLFWANDDRRGRELWVTDGTDVGTRIWAEVCPGDCAIDLKRGQRVEDVVFDGERSFFLTEDGVHGKELWTSDGTGGARLVADICPGGCATLIRQMTLIGGKVYFEAFADGFDGGSEPWISDGTAEGTRQIADLVPGSLGSFPQQFLPFGDGAVFLASTEQTAREWWQTDGTPEGTELLADLCPGDCSLRNVQAVPFGDGILFGALITETQQFNLYRAMPGQTPQLLETLCEGSCSFNEGPMVQLGDRVYTTRDSRVWSTDGTAAGTRVEVHLPNNLWSVEDLALLDGGTLILLADDGATGLEVHRQQGNGLSPQLLRVTFRATLHGLGDQAIVVDPETDSVSLYSTDGTAEGTVLYEQIETVGGWGSITGFPTVRGDQVVFSVRPRDDFRLGELVSTGGVGTSLQTLWEIEERPASVQPNGLVSVGRRVVFRDDLGDRENNNLWAADDFANTEILARNIEPEDFEGVELNEGTHVFFTAFDSDFDRGPWLTDGTLDGTFVLNDPSRPELSYGREPVALNGELFFLADQGLGQKLWRSGVDEDSVELVIDLRPDYGNVHEGCPVCSPPIQLTPIFPRHLSVVGHGLGARLVFVGGQAASGAELWTSDGTEAGTKLLFDLAPGSADADPEDLIPAGSGLIFTADPGDGRRLYRWDGQSEAPTVVGEVGEIWATAYDLSRATWLEFLDGQFRLWTSDGTESGTRMVGALPEGTVPDRSILPTFERAFFVASNASVGAELWVAELRVDGDGFRPVADLWSGPNGSFPEDLTRISNQIYFSADDGISGRELWRLDLTQESLLPRRLSDLAPGMAPSSPRDFARLDLSRLDPPAEYILLTADDGEGGRELWVAPVVDDGVVCRPDATTLCLEHGRFRVRVHWRDEIQGTEGVGRAIPSGGQTGFFWFFDSDNLELAVKVIDGRDFNDAYWFFYGALSDVAYDITVEDLALGGSQIYRNPQGNLCGQGDIEAFPSADAGPLGLPEVAFSKAFPEEPGTSRVGTSPVANVIEIPASPAGEAVKTGPCISNTDQLCLLGRFQVTVDWTDHDGNTGQGRVLFSNGQTGTLWFFEQQNVELVVKAIDGTDFNDSFWIFYGALTDVQYTLRVVDTVTGEEVVYQNPAGNLCGRGDTSAFPMMP